MGIQAASRKQQARALFAPLPRHYHLVAALTSFGQDPRWRRAMVEAVHARPEQRVLDVATGTGLVAAALVRRYRCAVVGVDQSEEMLAGAEARLRRDPLLKDAITLVQAEAEHLPFPDESFDHVTFTYLLRYVEDPEATLREVARVLKPGGTLAYLEFGIPTSQPSRVLWHAYTKVGLPTLCRLVSKEWAQTGAFLSRSIPAFYERYPLHSQLQMWRAAGVPTVTVRIMSFGAGVVIWGAKDVERRPPTAGGPLAGVRGVRRGEATPPAHQRQVPRGQDSPRADQRRVPKAVRNTEDQDGCADPP